MTSRTSFSADTQKKTNPDAFSGFEKNAGINEGSFSNDQAGGDFIDSSGPFSTGQAGGDNGGSEGAFSTGQAGGDLGDNGGAYFHKNDTGFLARQRQLFKRRLWPAALTFLGFLLYNVVGLATALTMSGQYAIEEHLSAAEQAARLREVIDSMLGYANPSVLMILVPVAAVLAIEGFSWMDSRSKVDFYESQPLSRGKRFLDICFSSFLYFFFSYVITLEAGLLITGFFHALTRAVLAEIVWNSLCVFALFLAVYGLGVLAAMLTGNVIVACLAFMVLILYEPIFRAVLGGYSSEYLTTYVSSSGGLISTNLLNPVTHYYNSAAFDLKMPLILIGIAALYFALAWLSYRVRKNEHAGTPVVFGPVRTVVRIAMSVIVGLVLGLFISFVRDTFFINLAWMLLFTVITACIMQIIYDLDFRALFRRPLEILASAAIVTLIFLAFLFDVTGFDRFVPDPEKVQDAALYCMNTDTAYVSDDGHYEGNDSFPRRYMRLTNIEDVTAIAEYGQKYTRLQKSKSGFPGSGQTSDDKGGTENTFWNFEVLYRMKNGKEIYRAFLIPSTVAPSMMDTVTATEEYREGTVNIYHDNYLRKALSESVKIEIYYTNGSEYLSGPLLDEAMYEEFRKAYTQDLEQYSYSFARQNRPVGSVGISLTRDSKRDDIPAVSYSIYPSYSRTIDFLKKNGCWLEPLDLSAIPTGDYDSLTPDQQKLIDNLDTSVLSNPFNTFYY
ncbi:MAG: DUF6449 domain-containing protein [Eubacteriales bacterium]|nr:DUF6449 domain-containing protein [Eubacteriales bacterium]